MRFLTLLIGISLWTGNALAQNAALPAFPARTVYLPVVGLASTETAQVNVINLATSGGSEGTQDGGATASCAGSISFYDASANLIPASTATTFTIGSGQIFSATVPYSAIVPADRPATGNGRTALRAVVSLTATNGASAPCSLAANLEIFDTSTGVTHVHVEGTPAFPGLFGFAEASRSQR